MPTHNFFAATIILLATACDQAKAPAPGQPVTSSAKGSSEDAPNDVQMEPARKKTQSPPPVGDSAETASVGQAAPEFSLPDLSGKVHKLSDYRGKPVVLEWFNPECPFVRASHTKGSLLSAASELEKKGFIYLAINSGAPGKQGHGNKVNSSGKESLGITHPILLDESGAIGKAYGATNTPHIFVIDQKGALVYAGAVDNSPDGEGKSPEGGTLVNYLTQATEELLAGKPISTPTTKAYGCGVKYSG